MTEQEHNKALPESVPCTETPQTEGDNSRTYDWPAQAREFVAYWSDMLGPGAADAYEKGLADLLAEAYACGCEDGVTLAGLTPEHSEACTRAWAEMIDRRVAKGLAAAGAVPLLEAEVLEARNEAATVRRAYLHEKDRAETAMHLLRMLNHMDLAKDIEDMAYRGAVSE